jgi:Spherulation-specific family 4
VDHVSAAALTRRAWMLGSAATAGTVLLLSVLLGRNGERRPGCSHSLIPAYLPPAALLDLAKHAPAPRLLVVNPASGPGAQPQPAYRRAIKAARESGARVLGYVPTTFGARPADAVVADAGRYATWYGVDGVFLDEVSHDPAQLPYYRALSARLRAAGVTFVALNPGTVPARGYLALADVVVTFEGPFADYATRVAQTPGWLRALPLDRTAHLVYATSREQLDELLREPRRAGYLYATSGTPPDPWGVLPPYLGDEEARLGACA